MVDFDFSHILVQWKDRGNWSATERHSIYRRTGLEAELRARAVADESLSKTVGVLKDESLGKTVSFLKEAKYET